MKYTDVIFFLSIDGTTKLTDTDFMINYSIIL